MLKYFITTVHRRRRLVHPRIVLTVPSGITQVEKRAVRDSAQQAGAREVLRAAGRRGGHTFNLWRQY